MTVALMQPYLFPYLGYYQLLHAADLFVFYDDAQFRKGGYINRNTLVDGRFTVPLAKGSTFAAINERRISPHAYGQFRKKWHRRFRATYGTAPFFEATRALANQVFTERVDTISSLAERSIEGVGKYLDLPVVFRRSSTLRSKENLRGQERVLDIVTKVGADRYVNSIGGRELYQSAAFAAQGIGLHFLQPTFDVAAPKPGFHYSILHLLASHPPATVRGWLTEQYTLVRND